MIQVLTVQKKNVKNSYKIRYNILHFIVHIDITVLLVTCSDKYNAVLSFQNLKNTDIVYICFINKIFLSIFIKQYFPFQEFPIPPFWHPSPILKNFLYPSYYAHFREILSPFTKWELCAITRVSCT